MERNFSCAPGRYECRVYLNGAKQTSPFQRKQDSQLLWNTVYEIIAKPEESFVNERVYLTRAHFWSPETGHDETASIAIMMLLSLTYNMTALMTMMVPLITLIISIRVFYHSKRLTVVYTT